MFTPDDEKKIVAYSNEYPNDRIAQWVKDLVVEVRNLRKDVRHLESRLRKEIYS